MVFICSNEQDGGHRFRTAGLLLFGYRHPFPVASKAAMLVIVIQIRASNAQCVGFARVSLTYAAAIGVL